MSKLTIPKNYSSALNLHDTQLAIKTVKDFFQGMLAQRLSLTRVSAPLFVDPTTGLNDNLNGYERPVTFGILEQGDKEAEVVHSLAKWKRYALKKPDLKVDPEQDQILFDHRPVIYEKYSYYLFHKPAGCVTARCDRLNRTVMDFFPESMRKEFAPVGRLDKDTEGFLLITNDGELTHRLLSPAYHVKKTYFVQVDQKTVYKSLSTKSLNWNLKIGRHKGKQLTTFCPQLLSLITSYFPKPLSTSIRLSEKHISCFRQV